jgi:hypothetical protein
MKAEVPFEVWIPGMSGIYHGVWNGGCVRTVVERDYGISALVWSHVIGPLVPMLALLERDL